MYVILFLAVGEEVWKSDESPAYPVGGPSSGNERPTYTGTYMIARLKPATVYMARVSSQNSYGYSHPSQVFKFATRGAGKQHNTLLIVTLHLNNFENNFDGHLTLFKIYLSDPIQKSITGNGGGTATMKIGAMNTLLITFSSSLALLFLL